MRHSRAPGADRRAERNHPRNGRRAGVRAATLLAVLSLPSACVDLTPPQAVVDYRDGHGGVHASGGVLTPGTGGVVSSGGSIVTSGGSTGSGGTSSAAGSGGTAVDVPQQSGGASGGNTGVDAGTGGVLSTGGVLRTGGAGGSSGGKGGTIPATGGAISSGGIVASGGTVASGGVVASGGTLTSTGGKVGSGGSTGTGGIPVYACGASAVAPANGIITDFKDWNATTSKWGSGTLTGTVYAYNSSNATMTAKVEGTTPGLHLAGSVPGGAYAGGGLTFYTCLSLASFTKVSFDIYGSAANCTIELQLQTFEQRPVEQVPAGGCKNDGGTNCFKFPAKAQIVALSGTVAAPGTTVTATLSSFSNWSAAAATQFVAMQWQFLNSGGTCAANATFTNIKFLP